MKFLDPHVHMFARTTDDYKRMARAGIVAVVEPSFWLGCNRRHPESFFDYFEQLITFEFARAAKYGIRHFTCVGINPKEANDLGLAREVVAGLRGFLDRDRVVAIGEIGFDRITGAEEEILRAQLTLAEKTKTPVVVHSPHTNKPAGVSRICAIIEEMRLTKARILVDHNTEETIETTRNTGVWAGHTVYPTKLSPARAAGILRRYGLDRMIVNSSADWGESSPLAVPCTARLMARRGFSTRNLKRVFYDNPKAFFSQSPHFGL